MRPIWRFLIGQAVLLVLAGSLPWVVVVNVPGVYTLTAPLLCPAEQRAARVVEYHTDLGDSTGTNHTLVCLGPDGDITEAGSWKPIGVVFGAIWLALQALELPIQVLGMAHRRAGRRQSRPPSALTLDSRSASAGDLSGR